MPDEAATDGIAESCFRTKRELDEGDEPRRALELARRGDPLGFRYLYQRYADNVYSYVCTFLHDDHEAEDVTQQVFTKLLTSVHKYQERSVPFSAWILRIARNAAIDQMRRNRHVLTDDVRGTTTSPRRSLTIGADRSPTPFSASPPPSARWFSCAIWPASHQGRSRRGSGSPKARCTASTTAVGGRSAGN